MNLHSRLTELNYNIDEDVVIYSIVDSLFEQDGVESVQISVNGSSDMVYREQISLDQNFKENEALIEK